MTRVWLGDCPVCRPVLGGRKEEVSCVCLWRRSLGPSKTTQTLGAPEASLVPREEFFLFYCVI